MATKQQIKSKMTRQEVKESCLHLFLERSYEETSIKDITENAGYAVGSFYRHWQSKQQILLELWDDFASDFIRQSIENAPKDQDIKNMVDYLIQRSDKFSENKITKKLYLTTQILSAQQGYDDLSELAKHYTDMLYQFLKTTSENKNDKKLRSTASIMHTILNAHAMQYTEPHIVSGFDNETLACCLISIINSC